eukprot:5330399-Pyramimonas_sp.AAC.1
MGGRGCDRDDRAPYRRARCYSAARGRPRHGAKDGRHRRRAGEENHDVAWGFHAPGRHAAARRGPQRLGRR